MDRHPAEETHPHLRDFFAFLKLLEGESDRGSVLISTGYLEEQLKQVLLTFFVAGRSPGDLFKGATSPLGTFSARTAACYAMGLISEDEHHDLNQLRHIRNDFAHNIHTSFESQSVIDRCRILRLKAHDYDSKDLGPVRLPPVGQFKTAATGLMLNLVNRPAYVGRERLKARPWPY